MISFSFSINKKWRRYFWKYLKFHLDLCAFAASSVSVNEWKCTYDSVLRITIDLLVLQNGSKLHVYVSNSYIIMY